MFLEEIREFLCQEIDRVKEAAAGGVVLDRDKYIELMGVIQGLKMALDITKQSLREEAHTDDGREDA
jgi:hypothetical protein